MKKGQTTQQTASIRGFNSDRDKLSTASSPTEWLFESNVHHVNEKRQPLRASLPRCASNATVFWIGP